MSNFLTKEAPYVVTALVAGLGWFATTIVDRVVSAPTLEYVVQSPCKADRRVCAHVTNLSEKLFNKLQFEFLYVPPGSGNVTGANVEEIQPPLRSSILTEVANGGAVYKIEKMQPGRTMALIADFDSKIPPKFVLTAKNTDDAVLLVERGLRTWFVRNEIAVYVVLASIWAVFVGIWLWRKP